MLSASLKSVTVAALLVLPVIGCAGLGARLAAQDGKAPTILQRDPNADQAASVMRVIDLKAGDAGKIFITVGGDPAINGLYTYYATLDAEGREWRTWKVGDFNDVSVIRDTPDETGLKVSKTRVLEDGSYKTEDFYWLIPAPKPEDVTLTVIPVKPG